MFSKKLVLTAAVLSFGVIAAIDIAQSRTETNATAAIAARFPAKAEMFAAINPVEPTTEGRKQDRGMMPADGCSREHWPYIADECLTSNQPKAKKPVRTITIERRVASANTSQLVRVPVQQVASR